MEYFFTVLNKLWTNILILLGVVGQSRIFDVGKMAFVNISIFTLSLSQKHFGDYWEIEDAKNGRQLCVWDWARCPRNMYSLISDVGLHCTLLYEVLEYRCLLKVDKSYRPFLMCILFAKCLKYWIGWSYSIKNFVVD